MHIADSQYTIKLHSGRKISLEENYQNLTYLGLLEGLPNQQMNDNIIKELSRTAKEKLWGDTNPFIIQPISSTIKLSEERKNYFQTKGPSFVPTTLPKITCMCHFSSGPITDNYMFSSLTIAWFQNDWMMPIEESILNQIKAMNWDKYAIQGDY